MSEEYADSIIVGGGLIGLLTARELSQAGQRVILLERGQTTGQESSWAGGGILSPLYPWRYPDAVTALARWSQTVYRDLAESLVAETGIDPEWTASGLLMLDPADDCQARLWARHFGYHLEHWACDQVYAHEPALARRIGHALWMPDVAQVRNPRLVAALRRSLEQAGVRVVPLCAVTELLTGPAGVEGVASTCGRWYGKAVIVAAGAWSGPLATGWGVPLPVRPVRGQMLLFRAIPGLLNHIVLGHDRYIIPRRDGRILVGSTMEEVGFDKSTTAEARAALHEAAVQWVPMLAQYPIERHWAGLRPGSPAGVPFIGADPHRSGLYFNCGHFRNGVVLGPASARLLADIVLGRPPILGPADYAMNA